MHATLRSYTTAGVALVGASVIAVSPIAPPPPDIQEATTRVVSSAQVELSALGNPLEGLLQILTETVTNVGAIGQTIAANPTPILRAVLENQMLTGQFFANFALNYASNYVNALGTVPQSINNALQEIAAGDIGNGFANLLIGATITPFIAPVLFMFQDFALIPTVLSNPVQNLANVIATATSLGTLFPLVGVLTGVLGPVLQIGYSAQDVYDALQAGDPVAALNAVLSYPLEVLNTTINGNPAIPSGGLLGEQGIVQAFLTLAATIAGVIQPPAGLPSAAVTTLSQESSLPNAADPGLDGGTLVSLAEATESSLPQLNSPAAAVVPDVVQAPEPEPSGVPEEAAVTVAVETDTATDTETETEAQSTSRNTAVAAAADAAADADADDAKDSAPASKKRSAFDGTAERLTEKFNDAVKGFDKALKGDRDNADAGSGSTSGASGSSNAGDGASGGGGGSDDS
jgi:uncharacterized membrane protein YgcG